jgi:putative PIN family toxin of toxin-antitoxin system
VKSSTPSVVVDTNVFVSMALGGRATAKFLDALASSRFQLLYSPVLLQEIQHVLSRGKFGLEPSKVDFVTSFLRTRGNPVFPSEKVDACRDPKDNPILECALAGRADAIVTGDKDLLLLNPFRNIPIITPRQFLNNLSSSGSG